MSTTKYVPVFVSVFAISCNGVQSSPVAPSPQPVRAVTVPAVPPTGPHFALEVQNHGPVTEGQDWIGSVALVLNPTILRPELPAALRTDCAGDVHTFPGFGAGSMPLRCALPLGTHTVTVSAVMADGRVYATGTTARVTARPVQPIPYTTSQTVRDTIDVTFTFDPFEGARYEWDFDDGTTDRTRVNHVTHRYPQLSRERVVTVTVTRDGRTLATGTVVGKW